MGTETFSPFSLPFPARVDSVVGVLVCLRWIRGLVEVVVVHVRFFLQVGINFVSFCTGFSSIFYPSKFDGSLPFDPACVH